MDCQLAQVLPPAGIRFVADASLDRRDNGRILIGGSPARVIRLSDAGATALSAWLDDQPLGDDTKSRSLARRLLNANLVHPIFDLVVAPESDPEDDLDVTIVIPVYNDARGLEQCLKILRPTSPSDLPIRRIVGIVVVDDASDNSAEIAAIAERYQTHLVCHATNKGPAAARNSGLAQVTTPLVAFVDSDVELPRGSLNHLVEHFQDQVVVAVAPRVRSKGGHSLLQRYEAHHSPLDLGDNPALVGPTNPVSYLPAAALVAKVKAISAVGGFDAALRSGEDVDLIWRLIDDGGIVRYDPAAEVRHRPRDSWPALLNQRHSYGASAVALGNRHGSRIAPARLSVGSAATLAVLASGQRLLGIGVGVGMFAGSVLALKHKLRSIPDSLATATRLTTLGYLRASYGLGRALLRVWCPLALLLALLVPRTRPIIVATTLAPLLSDWLGGSQPAGFCRSLALRLIDDIAYGTGVWQGVLKTKDTTALKPVLQQSRPE